jgi:hypothetical protein
MYGCQVLKWYSRTLSLTLSHTTSLIHSLIHTLSYTLSYTLSHTLSHTLLSHVPRQNHILSGDSPSLGCAELCVRTASCAAFWSYTDAASSSEFGRCCLKGAGWVNGSFPTDWRKIPGGGFYAMSGPPAPPTPGNHFTATRAEYHEWGTAVYE